jgi:nucleoside-diphosphate-sugar epimerase
VRCAIAGAHGKVAQLLTRALIGRGDSVIGLIRNPDHAEDLRSLGATAELCDLEQATVGQIAEAIRGSDMALFAAGAGPGSGAERKLTVDRDGCTKLLAAAAEAGVARFVVVSSVGAENPPTDDDVFSVYLRAKADADDAVRASDREWTIVRPGGLTDDPGSGCARIDTEPFRGRVSREDVATVLAEILREPRSIGTVLYVNGGDRPISESLDAALAALGS